jgi:hypothetical protein
MNSACVSQPSFSYSISRPIPYKWFKWVVIAGGILYDYFFFILNLAANGCVLDVRYDVQHNETASSKHWTLHFSVLCGVMGPRLPVGNDYCTISIAYALSVAHRTYYRGSEKSKQRKIPDLPIVHARGPVSAPNMGTNEEIGRTLEKIKDEASPNP